MIGQRGSPSHQHWDDRGDGAVSTITILGGPRRGCSGPTRRETLKVGSLSLLGGLFHTGSLLAAERAAPQIIRPARAKSVVLLYLQGGPPTQDMLDLKPEAPGGVGGEFKPIASSASGVDVCELLPRTARTMHHAAVVRSVFHNGGCHKNLPMYTGYDVNLPDEEFRDTDPPSMGSVCAYLRRASRGRRCPPTPICRVLSVGGKCVRRLARMAASWAAGSIRSARNVRPMSTSRPTISGARRSCAASRNWRIPSCAEGITLDRLQQRKRLVESLDAEFQRLESQRDFGNYSREQQLAFEMLTSAKVREAFDLSKEDARTRDRYGRTLFGSSTLLARRLVERGVQFVNVSWDNFSKRFEVSKAAWDTHQRNFPMLRDTLLPSFDQTYSAFIEDLDARGLLDQTLVVTMGEMGRTPKINTDGGRDHWTFCYSVLLAAPASAEGWFTAPRMHRPRSSRTSRSTSAISAPRSITCSASIPRCPSTIAQDRPSP